MTIRWKDYEKYSCAFIEGKAENVAMLSKKTYQLTDVVTGAKFYISAVDLPDAKILATEALTTHWVKTFDLLNQIL